MKKYSIALLFFQVLTLGILAFFNFSLKPIDNPHFYRATFFWGEPRLNRPWLTTFLAEPAFGSTTKAFNRQGQKTSLLNIYGPYVLRALGQGLPNLDPSNFLDQILINAAQLPEEGTFGMAVFNGHFKFFELPLQVYQNLSNGFFFQVHLPIRSLTIDKIRFQDISPEIGFLNQLTPEWVLLLNHLEAITERHNLSLAPTHQAGAGDLSFLGGWASTNYNTTYLDFVDVSAKLGILIPTGRKALQNHAFSLPLGYNGHIGVPLKFDIAIGYWEWLTLGSHIGALFLIEKNQNLFMRTSDQQNGLILLTSGIAQVDPGTYWDIAVYSKADHLWKGLSFLLGYTYTQKDADCVQPYDPTLFKTAHDPRWHSWKMHELHFAVEYDWNTSPRERKPIIAFFYNMIVSGKNIFATNAKSVSMGINIAYDY